MAVSVLLYIVVFIYMIYEQRVITAKKVIP